MAACVLSGLAALELASASPAAAQSGLQAPLEEASPESGNVPGQSLGNISDADMWRAVRRGAQGKVSIADKQAGILIQDAGEEWRATRNGPVSTYGSWFLFGVAGLAALYFIIRGRIRINHGRSGHKLIRFSLNQRIVHWFAAALFVLLALSGLILLYGKHVLIPLVGPAAFGAIASAAMQGHNLFGPLFIFSIIALFFSFVKDNGYVLVDLGWFARLGGFFGGHAHAAHYNGGEKTWFWSAVILGLILSGSGLVLDFPNLVGDVRQGLQLANLVHAVAALLFIGFGLGHIYLGTIGMEGALESMTRGEVDENWAKEHHDLWYEEMTGKAAVSTGDAAEETAS